MTGGDPSSSASHIKESAVEQVGWAGGQLQPMGAGGRGGGRSITPKSTAYVAVKWVKHRAEEVREGREDDGVSLRLMTGSSGLLRECVCVCLARTCFCVFMPPLTRTNDII